MALVTRVISEKKLNKNEDLLLERIPTLRKRFEEQLTDDLKHNVLIVGDSKVRHLDQEMTAKTNLTNFWRKGAEIDNTRLNPHIYRHIQRQTNPIVLLWFGTCHLTKFTDQSRTFIDIVDNHDEIINRIVDKYTQFKQRLIYKKSTTTVIFIDCPYFSITEWNSRRGHLNPKSFANSQEILEGLITELNKRIQEVNAPIKPPLIAQDMLFKIKKRSHHSQTKKISYSVLTDGIHPGKDISKLWLIKLNNFVTRLINAEK